MKELGLRAVTGAAYVLVTLGAALAGPVTTFLLFLPVTALASAELHRLLHNPEQAPPSHWGVLIALATYLGIGLVALIPQWTISHAAAITLAALLLAFTLLLVRSVPDPGRAAGALLLQAALVALPFGIIPHLFEDGPWLFVGFMVLLWTNDTGAYLVGRSLGRTKLLPSASPKKTVEGFVGGIVLTVAVAWLLAGMRDLLSTPHWLVCGVLVAVTATLGDLLESSFKRNRGVKDSGTILPGHGGILDRFDGFLLALPAMFIYLAIAR